MRVMKKELQFRHEKSHKPANLVCGHLKRVPIKTYILNKSNHKLDKQTTKQKERKFSKSPVHADFETVLNLIHSYTISADIVMKKYEDGKFQ